MRAAAGRHNYPEFTVKNESTRTEAELAEIRERYREGVPPEIIEHMAGKLAEAITKEGKCVGEDQEHSGCYWRCSSCGPAVHTRTSC